MKRLPCIALFFLLTSFIPGVQPPVASRVSISACVENCPAAQRIFSSHFKRHTYSLKFGIVLNCATRELYSVDYARDALRLDFEPAKGKMVVRIKDGQPDTGYVRTGALCDCYFNIDLELKNIPQEPKCVIVNKRRHDAVKGFVVLNKMGREE